MLFRKGAVKKLISQIIFIFFHTGIADDEVPVAARLDPCDDPQV